MNPQTYAVATVAAATVVAAGSKIAQGQTPSAAIFIGGTVAAFGLSIAAGPLPGMVRALATLIILGTALTAGYAVVKPITSLVTTK